MKDCKIPTLRIGDLVARLPIVQGGMGIGVSLSSLASAVANAGGVGVLSAVGMGFSQPGYQENPVKTCLEALRAEIRKARALTNGILGVNVMVASAHFGSEVRAAVEEGIDILFAGAGLPLDLPGYLIKGAKTKLVPIVSSARAAAMLIKRWVDKYRYPPDALVVEGPMAGGHLGFRPEQIFDPQYALENLVPDVLEVAQKTARDRGNPIPVIAGGGVYTGADIARFLHMGASGVQMGTRFVATHECDAAEAFKEAYVRCKAEDLVIIQSPVGLPGRAINGEFLRKAREGALRPLACPYQCLKTCDARKSPYCIARALLRARGGRLASGFVFAGANAYRVDAILSVRDLMEELSEQFAAAWDSD